MAIGKNLKYICKMRGITLKELSEKSGVPLGTIYSITLRDPGSINSETMKALCDTLGIESVFIESGDLLGCYEGYGIPKEEKTAKSTNGFGALISLKGYGLEYSEMGFRLIYPNGKIYIDPDEFESLSLECSKMVRYVLNDFISNNKKNSIEKHKK